MSNNVPNNAPMGGPTDKVVYNTQVDEMLNSYRIRPWIRKPQDFNSGICGCFEDCGNCCDTFWCWHLQLTSQYEVVASRVKYAKRNWSYCLLMCCADFCSGGVASAVCVALTRYSVRKSFGMPCDCAEGCTDCLKWWCCGPCMVCQNHREMHMRGYFAEGCCSSPRNEWINPTPQGIMLQPQNQNYPPAENPAHQPGPPNAGPYNGANNGPETYGGASYGNAPAQQQPYGYNQPPPTQPYGAPQPYGVAGGEQPPAFYTAQAKPV